MYYPKNWRMKSRMKWKMKWKIGLYRGFWGPNIKDYNLGSRLDPPVYEKLCKQGSAASAAFASFASAASAVAWDSPYLGCL